MAHYKATIEYDGTEFHGFQRQLQARTVQGVLEDVLSTLNGGTRISLRGAGRTDSGVHAVGQVIDFQLPYRGDEVALQRALNAMLPQDVAVREISRAPKEFHPRYDALSRVYIYSLLNTPIRQPLYYRQTLQERHPLNELAMDEALKRLQGQHDFASFGRPTSPSGRTTRIMLATRVWREGELIRIKVEANGFLYRMVRSIVGTLLVIGRGQKAPAWIDSVLAARHRGAAPQVVRPTGLCLVAVRYPEPLGRGFGAPTEEKSKQ
ncbi:MAG: tRNA pseudouridine(38-40) synthase TruA [Ardenticatenaceae bacterium]